MQTVKNSYSPVQYVYREAIEEEIARLTAGRVFYFDESNQLTDADGRVVRMEERVGDGIFIIMDNLHEIRIDRIITLFGKPGAAYDEYSAYGDACMDCTGGYPVD
jgi:hypothetical protein